MIRLNCLLLLLITSFTLTAQFVLKGYVYDENNLPYANVKVLIEQTDQYSYTDNLGFYQIDNLAEGTYALSVDYLYDKQYFTVVVPGSDTQFDVLLERRLEFNEILVKDNQLEISAYSNARRLDSEQLENLSNEKDLPYILGNVAGVVLQSDAGNGVGYTGIRIRGMDPSHIQLTINGIPFNDSESGLSYFVDIPDIVSYTEEITVLKGNIPNRAGTPSFGGAIDVNTNKLHFDPFFSIKTQVGSFNTYKLSLTGNSGLLDNKYQLEFGLSRQKSSGYIDRSDSELKSFRISGTVVKKNYSIKLNYMHGNERTGQAWFGLPIQYEAIDSLRTFNLAGTEKPGTPYTDEKDNYKQDHIQFFYQRQLSPRVILNSTMNYTGGSGFYENYKANQMLEQYAIFSPQDSVADLVRKPWLQNDFLFANIGFVVTLNKRIEFRPSLAYSYYNGDHFGIVSWVDLEKYEYQKNRYYQNTGIKNELSTCLKTSVKMSAKMNLSLDFQYRKVSYEIDGRLMSGKDFKNDELDHLVNSKLFVEYRLSKNISAYASLGLMQREAFREDILLQDSPLKPEELIDYELGTKYRSKTFSLMLNAYAMLYNRQFALSGRINEVGEALRTNLGKSHRIGVEFESEFQITNYISLWNSSNFSTNKIDQLIEYIPVYSAEFQVISYDQVHHQNTDISYSPTSVIHSGIKINILEEHKKQPSVNVVLNHHYISEFYLDNYSNDYSRMNAYQYLEFGLSVNKYIAGWGDLEFKINFYNLSNERYSSHGWISSFRSDTAIDIQTDPYLGTSATNQYFYKALYPQALRHFSLGINFKFR